MFSRAIVIIILTTLMLSPGPAVRARDVSEDRTPAFRCVRPGLGRICTRQDRKSRLAPYPLAERRPVEG